MERMGTIYEELDEAKFEIEKLKANYQIKLELSESLKRAHNEQLIKTQEACLKVEKLSQELNEKAEEISVTKQMYEELHSNLKEKEAIIKHLSSANDKLRADSKEKLQRCEDENRGLALALDEAIAKTMDQEQQIRLCKEEIEGLKGLVSVSHNKSSEADRKVKRHELRQEDDVLLKLEEEKGKYENELKWKKEQFSHLEEAHEKLKSQFRVKEKEWKKEKSSLLDDISTLQANLDSQTRISQSLQSRLEMCNQALAHEESKRKLLEVQLSESRAHFDNVCVEYEEAKSTIESLTCQRDNDIASLRNSLGTRESLYKEMEYKVRMLEQEKQDLLLSLKEFQETQIREAGNSSSSSLSKLRNKLRGLEQVHKDCSARLKAKEVERSSQLEILMEKLNCCRSELESKTMILDQLSKQAEVRDPMLVDLAMQNEEAALLSLVLKSELFEAKLKLADAFADIDHKNEESSKKLSILAAHLEMKESALIEAQKETEEHKKVADLAMKVESINFAEEQQFPLLKELERQQKLLTESYACQSELRTRVCSMESKLNEVHNALNRANEELDEKFCDGNEFGLEIWKFIAQELKTNIEEDHQMYQEVEASLQAQVLSLKRHLKRLHNALDRANEELAEKYCEGNEIEFELQIWKSIVEQLKNNLEENHHLRREVEASLLAQVVVEVNLKEEKESLLNLLEEKDNRIDELHQQIISLNTEMGKRESRNIIPANTENTTCCGSEQGSPLQNGIENSDDFQEEEEWMKKELEGAILAEVHAEKNYEHEKENLHQLVEERDQRIDDLQQLVKSLEQEFESSTGSFSSRLSEMQVQINMFREAWDKVTTAVVLKEIEIQEQNLIVVEMENDVTALGADLQANKLEVEKLASELKEESNRSCVLISELSAEKGKILEDVAELSSERENLFDSIGGLTDRLHKLSVEDMQLKASLDSILQTFDFKNFEREDVCFDPVKENVNLYQSPKPTKAEVIPDERLPLRALNN